MPVYDYDCAACGRRFEVIHGVHAEGPTACPLCGEGPVRKAVTAAAVHYRGSGWAKKERRSAAAKTSASDASADAFDASASASDGASADAHAGADDKPAREADTPAKKTESPAASSTDPAPKRKSDAPATASSKRTD
jgi:putative FmdB family regulatory protein